MLKKIKQIYAIMASNEGTLFTYAFAYSLIVGIAPFLIIAVVFVGNYAFEVNQIISFISRYVPEDLILPFIDYISTSNTSNLWILNTLLVASIWVGSKSIFSFLIINSEYDEVEINGMLLRILSVFYFVFLILIIIAFGVLMGFLNLSGRFLIVPILIGFMVMFYRLTSFRYTEIKNVLPGSIIAAILLLALGQLFFVYINRFSNYQTVYGPLASIMILLISCWFIAWVIFLGFAINIVFKGHAQNRPKTKLIQFLQRNENEPKEKNEPEV